MFRSLSISIRAAVCAAVACAALASAQDFQAPSSVIAGNEATISTAGSGTVSFYLIGTGISRKSEVTLGAEIRLRADDLRNAGAYLVVVCSSTCRSATFYVSASNPASLAFLVHPSRVPVGQGDAVSGVAFPFDRYRNLVQAPATIDFQLISGKQSLLSHAARSQDGVAWFRTASGKSAGTLQVIASLDDLSARRAVQQVASEPCNLRIKGERTAAGVIVQTEPVHDCAGNIVPDGTVVTFTAAGAQGKSTVDAPIKQGVARAQMTADGAAVISVASGVVMGNELRIGAQP
jgi:hypothetical protein